MTKVLITGMSAPQASTATNARTRGFAGVLNTTMTNLLSYEVDWMFPDIAWTLEDLDSYDHILVGISPVTSVSANYAYGALSIIEILYDSPKLTLFIDAPEPHKITGSLRSVQRTPESLIKEFYKGRKYFTEASEPETHARLLGCIDRLLTEAWPTTIYPGLPWKGPEFLKHMPLGLKDNLHAINLDMFEISTKETPVPHRQTNWAIDSFKPAWSIQTVLSLSNPVSPMTWAHVWPDRKVEAQLSESIGALVSSSRLYGTWWSYRYVQALSAGVPVATEWRESGIIDPSWAVLPALIETMEPRDRHMLARSQRTAYLKALPSPQTALRDLKNVLQMERNVR